MHGVTVVHQQLITTAHVSSENDERVRPALVSHGDETAVARLEQLPPILGVDHRVVDHFSQAVAERFDAGDAERLRTARWSAESHRVAVHVLFLRYAP